MNTTRSATMRAAAVALAIAAAPLRTLAQIPVDSWPTYHGDYSGRRYSTLKQIDTATVKNLTLAWVYRLNTRAPARLSAGKDRRRRRPGHRRRSSRRR
jgi:glucose dehydrogenase